MAQQTFEGVIVTGKSGQYRVIKELSSGMQAKVYEGLDLGRNKPVAIKILSATDQGAYERAEREARILQKLRPHNIMYMRDSGTYNDAGVLRFFCVLPLFPGGITLDDVIAREGAIKPLARALDILCQVASGLKEAHASGVVHRDIKPGNIMIHKDAANHETAYITDFGTAAVGNDLAEAFERKLTLDDRMLGTPQYMSPQQLIGASSDPGKESQRKDPRNDVYSFGVTAYEILTGETPFMSYTGSDLCEFTYKKRIGELLANSLGKAHPELPAELVLLVDRCMAYELEDRPQIAEALSELNMIKLDQPSSQPDPPRSLRRFKTPGSTRVSGDAETLYAPSTPPAARKSNLQIKIPESKPKPKSRLWMAFVPLLIAILVVVGWALFSDKLEQKRIGLPMGPMDSGSAAVPVSSLSASAKVASPTLSVTVSAKSKPKKAPVRPSGNYQWTPPTVNFDPSQPMPPTE